MRRISTTLVVLCLASAAFAKDKPRVTVQVVETETSERQSSYVVPGTDAKSTTTCNKSASETVYGKDNGRTVKEAVDTDSTSTCTTTARPATPPKWTAIRCGCTSAISRVRNTRSSTRQ